MNKYKSGSGWHYQSVRHSLARRTGHAGGTYADEIISYAKHSSLKCPKCGTTMTHKEYKGISVNASWDVCPKCGFEMNRSATPQEVKCDMCGWIGKDTALYNQKCPECGSKSIWSVRKKDKTDLIADAFYNEDYKELEKLTGIKATSQKEFEDKWEVQKMHSSAKIGKHDKEKYTVCLYSSETDEMINTEYYPTKKEAIKEAKRLKGKGIYVEVWKKDIENMYGNYGNPLYKLDSPRKSRAIGKAHMTRRFERHRIRNPDEFIKGSFRTQDIGKKGLSKRIAGRLKKTGRWATQSILISRQEPVSMKRRLRKSAKELIERRKLI